MRFLSGVRCLTVFYLIFVLSHLSYSQDIQNHPNKNVYFLSGLGADQRVFDKLVLDSSIRIHHINWLTPGKKESMESYAIKLLEQIDTTQPFRLVGLSFGGMMALKINEIADAKQIILISSHGKGAPLSNFYRGLIRFLLMHRGNLWLMKQSNRQTDKLFGAKTDEEKAMLKSILKETNPQFMRWALNHVSGWHYPELPNNVISIHGSADRMIDLSLVEPDIVVSGGEHLMVYSKAEEISVILNQILTDQ